MTKTALRVGKQIGIQTGATVSRATIREINPAGTLLRIEVEGLQGEGLYTVLASNALPLPRKKRTPKGAQAGEFTRYTFDWVTSMLKRKATPVPAEPPSYTPELLFDARWPDNSGYAIVTKAEKVYQCAKCGRLMSNGGIGDPLSDLAPVQHGTMLYGKRYCAECSMTVSECECFLCGEDKTISEIQESIGTYHLCIACFTTVSAEKWSEAEDKMADLAYDHSY